MADGVFYNDKEMPHAVTSIAHSPVMTADKTRVQYVRATVSVEFYLTATSPETLRLALETYRRELAIPGKTFTFTVDSKVLYTLTSAGDIAKGPVPSQLEVVQFYGGRTAHCRWRVSATQMPTATLPYWYLDFGFTVETTLDENFYQTRVVSGTLIIPDTLVSASRKTADSHRQAVYAFCPCPKGWQRTDQRWALSEDKLSLSFSFVDRQKYITLPPGVTSGDVTYSLSTGAPEIQMITKSISGYFEAPPFVDRKLLWNAFVWVYNRFFTDRPFTTKFLRLDRFEMRTPLYSNRIEFSVAAVFIIREVSLPKGAAAATGDTCIIQNNIKAYMLQEMTGVRNWFDLWKKLETFRPELGAYGVEQSRDAVLGPCGGGEISNRKIVSPEPPKFGNWRNGRKPDATTEAEGPGEITSHFHQHLAYKFDNGLVFIPVKSANEADVVQQTRVPAIYVIQTGESTTQGTPPEAPPPMYEKVKKAGDVFLLDHEVAMDSPSANGEYKLSWRYVMKLNLDLTGVLSLPEELRWPWPGPGFALGSDWKQGPGKCKYLPWAHGPGQGILKRLLP